jgi:hypothetical protein
MDGNKTRGALEPNKNDDKLDALIKRWQKETREEIKK